eukprot:bmy_08154T0
MFQLENPAPYPISDYLCSRIQTCEIHWKLVFKSLLTLFPFFEHRPLFLPCHHGHVRSFLLLPRFFQHKFQ